MTSASGTWIQPLIQQSLCLILLFMPTQFVLSDDSGFCPNTKPTDGTSCSFDTPTSGIVCEYERSDCCPESSSCAIDSCQCFLASFICFVDGISCPSLCPVEVPANEDGCNFGFGIDCMYGDPVVCDDGFTFDSEFLCFCSNSTFVCQESSCSAATPVPTATVECPEATPLTNNTCTLDPNVSCQYDPFSCPGANETAYITVCNCLDGAYVCSQNDIVCNDCPESPAYNGEACIPETSCQYNPLSCPGSDEITYITTCDCVEGSFLCYERDIQCENNGCPEQEPSPNSACSLPIETLCQYRPFTCPGDSPIFLYSCECTDLSQFLCAEIDVNCDATVPCPDSRPVNGEPCSPFGLGMFDGGISKICAYDELCCDDNCMVDVQCGCREGLVRCEQQFVVCPSACPSTKPRVGETCQIDPRFNCAYDYGTCSLDDATPATVCFCNDNNAFECQERCPSSCPQAPDFLENTPCDLNASQSSCRYEPYACPGEKEITFLQVCECNQSTSLFECVTSFALCEDVDISGCPVDTPANEECLESGGEICYYNPFGCPGSTDDPVFLTVCECNEELNQYICLQSTVVCDDEPLDSTLAPASAPLGCPREAAPGQDCEGNFVCEYGEVCCPDRCVNTTKCSCFFGSFICEDLLVDCTQLDPALPPVITFAPVTAPPIEALSPVAPTPINATSQMCPETIPQTGNACDVDRTCEYEEFCCPNGECSNVTQCNCYNSVFMCTTSFVYCQETLAPATVPPEIEMCPEGDAAPTNATCNLDPSVACNYEEACCSDGTCFNTTTCNCNNEGIFQCVVARIACLRDETETDIPGETGAPITTMPMMPLATTSEPPVPKTEAPVPTISGAASTQYVLQSSVVTMISFLLFG